MTDKNRPHIGFIGLGLMGRAIVDRLLDLEYPVTVLGRNNRAPIEAAVARGAAEANNARELAGAADVVLVCVDTSKSVEAVMYGPDGVIEGVKEGTIVVDFGTSIPDSTLRIGEALRARGARFLDSALGRTPTHARDGLLNLMVGGLDEDFAAVEAVFADVGENVVKVGDLGAGHTLKLINNFFGMTLATAMSEAFAVADVAGITRENLYRIMSSGPLHSPMMDFVKANAVDGDAHKLGFSIANARKDLGYFSSMMSTLNIPSFIGGATNQALTMAVARGYGDSDVPVMVDFFESVFENASK